MSFKINITIFGYYGFHNFGDDLMLRGLLTPLIDKE